MKIPVIGWREPTPKSLPYVIRWAVKQYQIFIPRDWPGWKSEGEFFETPEAAIEFIAKLSKEREARDAN